MVVAQPSGFPKLQKLYERGKYEKLIRKADRAARKNTRVGEPHFYKAMAYYKLAHSTDVAIKKEYPTAFQETVNALLVAKAKDRTNTLLGSADTTLVNAVSRELQAEIAAHVAANRLRDAKLQALTAIRLFADTTPYYTQLFPNAVVKAKNTPAPNTTSTPQGNSFQPNITHRFPEQLPNREEVIKIAKQQLGIKYTWTGENPKTGFDCSGFMLYVMRNFGYEFIHGATEMSKLGKEVPITEAQKGDWVFFGEKQPDGTPVIKHVGMLISDKGKTPEVIHSVTRGVTTAKLDAGYWARQILFVKTVLE